MIAVDLYSGIGGWTLGLEMAGIKVVRCYEWWDRAIETYNKNLHPVATKQDIRALQLDAIDVGGVDIIVGSPPCTQFSYSNRGGGGDIADGLKDVIKFLEIVAQLKPKFWAMENVPRVKKILETELAPGGKLERYRELVSILEVVDVSEFGVPQRRRRMIAGHFPFELLSSYKQATPRITLGEVLQRLHADTPTDPIYSLKIGRNELTEMETEQSLDEEETRLNREAKCFHTVYNKMSFPDELDRPARTVTALCTRVSRESIVIDDPESPGQYRRLSVRERACLQGFPVDYQLMGRSHSEKLKLIGNAIPPPLTYLIGHSMVGTSVASLAPLSGLSPKTRASPADALITAPTGQGRTYPITRSFKAAIPHLRFGSGMRFELANQVKDSWVNWEIRFFYGSSKDIRDIPLQAALWKSLCQQAFIQGIGDGLSHGADKLTNLIGNSTPIDIQRAWTRRDRGLVPFEIVDALGLWATDLIQQLREVPDKRLEDFTIRACGYSPKTERRNGLRKLASNATEIVAGITIGSWFNVMGPLRSPAAVGAPIQMEISA